MLTLSPWKILVIVVVALLVLGPEKLPSVARQVGGFWGDLRRLRTRLESEVRGVFPDLPPSHEVASAVRSPLAYLNRLADEHERRAETEGPAVDVEGAEGSRASPGEVDTGGNGASTRARPQTGASGRPPDGEVDGLALPLPGDPSMN